MIYEMRTYTVKIGKMNQYIKHFEEIGLPIISKYSKLKGYWYAETGELNQIIHIWEYESFNERIEKRKALYNDSEWLEKFIPTALLMLEKQESKIMNATSFSPIK